MQTVTTPSPGRACSADLCVAAATTCAAFVLTTLASRATISIFPTLPYMAAILAASWLRGIVSGITATLFSVPLAMYSVLEPLHRFRVQPTAVLPLAIFAIVGVLLSVHGWLIRRSATRARDALAARDEFLLVASHELRTPVTAADLNLARMTRALERGQMDVARKLVRRLSFSFARLAFLIDQLLDAATLRGGGAMNIETSKLDLREVVLAAVGRAQETAGTIASPIRCSAQSVTGAWDRRKVEQLVDGLITNAMKFGAGAPIEISLDADEAGAHLLVVDHGAGIAPEDRQRVLRPFERASNARNYGGLGLGLWLASEVARVHGGRLELFDTTGGGTSVSVHLPLAAEKVPVGDLGQVRS